MGMAQERPRQAAWLSTVVVPALAGLAASAVLLVDYVRGVGVFCDDTGGCGRVRQTAFASIGHVPMPVFGVAGFLVLGALALGRGIWARGVQLAIAATGAALALVLLYVQAFVVGAWCKFCVVADLSMIAIAVAAALRFYKVKWDVSRVTEGVLTGLALLLAPLVPFVYGMTREDPTPPEIASELAKTPAAQVTVIDFVDFECPFCRLTNADLAPLLAERQGKLRVVRKQVPLTRIHPHALDAARAACCGEAMGKGSEMADALFSAPEEELTTDGCEKIARELGLSVDAFRDCLKSPETDARIRADTALFRATGGHGLPTIWVGRTKLEGAQPKEALQHALDDALARAGS
jgi:predicted DsbA family dithiol-disulfide isomerase/uncharacterized membrane protein